MPRPSEAWEVVMDDIQEVPETSSTQNTLNSLRTVSNNNAGEFGTANSKTGVGSSLRAFASSLGLKRALQSPNPEPQVVPSTAQDSLTANAIPYKSIPESSPPKRDPFVLSDRQGDNIDAPLPGNPLLPGRPAPTNARMSMTVAPTNTTIRLVTTPFASAPSVVNTPPKLKPFQTSFDIVLGSPKSTASKWPASPQSAAPLYPPIPYDLLSPAKPAGKTAPHNNVTLTPHEPDIFSPVPGEKASGKLFSNTPSRPEPFLFGSPLPKNRLSNQDFGRAASSVLDEMNRRLGLAGDDKVGMSLLENRGKFKVDPTLVTSTSKPDLFGFDKAHEDAFAKMDSITTHYAAKRSVNQTKTANPQSSVEEGAVSRTKKRKSTALGADDRRRPISSGSRKKVLPGGFGEDDEEEEVPEENRRMSKRPRIHLPDPAPTPELLEGARKEEEERKKQKEIEAVRRRADARRRSSRVSGVGPRKSGGRPSLANAKKNKGTTSRFGFLSSAKNLVKNVWKGAGTANPPKPTNIPVASSSKAVKPAASTSKPPPVNESTSSKNSKSSFKPTSRFGFGSGPKTTATTSTTASSVTTNSRHDSMGQRKRESELRGVINTDGTANSRVSNASSNSSIGTGRATGSTGVKRSSSTLLAPTASSLAKSRPSSSDTGSKRTSFTSGTGITQQKRTSLLAAKEREKRASKVVTSPVLAPKPALEPITNVNTKGESSSKIGEGNGASLKKIFDRPLTTDTFSNPSKIPIPASKTHTRTTSSSSSTTNKEDIAPTNGKPTPTTGMPRRAANVKGRGFAPRKPRISRSQVIARLGEKRAAAAAASSSTNTSTRPQPSVMPKRMSADLGKGGRVRSSLGRQSYGGVNSKGRGSGVDVMLNAKKRARASEYYAKKSVRNSAVVQTSKADVGMVG
ncbi:hypothetical protein BDM02DRAFT_3109092 [Thelephora ganbajun]|uniref:Uncharacterized protein n=1 Tax=Thelephora ganbajun TaxID=370292 RepID=A0ACB6ZRT0_THEGA|nr:hypothetical protein BDM02DRAFT_3109092 [Thelephora ganbajun]